MALTLLCWVLLSPAVTLAFGVAVLPFSWPFIGALPIMVGIVVVLSHGGSIVAWWRRLPPLPAMGWVLASFGALSAAAAAIAHLNTAEALPVAAAAGLFNARAWYGMALIAARVQPRSANWLPARVLFAIPLAPMAGLLVLVLVVGTVRLIFDGTIHVFGAAPGPVAAQSVAGLSPAGGAGQADVGYRSADFGTGGPPAVSSPGPVAGRRFTGAVLVIEGWGSTCCDAADGLRAQEPGMLVRQFSYRGLDAHGNPLPSGLDDDDLPLPQLGDKLASQLRYLHRLTRTPVDIVAESEGTLGVYAMLARHPRLPVRSVSMLSPIVSPGQIRFPDRGAVPPAALDELNHLVGSMSPYGGAGAQRLLSSVSQFGARYFSSARNAGGPLRWMGVLPLADALTLPNCGLPREVVVVPAFHGGLLGDPVVLKLVARFIDGASPASAQSSVGLDQGRMRTSADVISSVATAWRMPEISTACAASPWQPSR